jgi:hypothetical protein
LVFQDIIDEDSMMYRGDPWASASVGKILSSEILLGIRHFLCENKKEGSLYFMKYYLYEGIRCQRMRNHKKTIFPVWYMDANCRNHFLGDR